MSKKIFVFGQSGSGKSTICASICYYFFEQAGTAPRLNLNERNREGTRYLLNEWIGPLRSRKFPKKTEPDEVIEVDLAWQDIESSRTEVLTLYEVAGETVRKLDPLRRDHDDVLLEVRQALYLADAIVLVASAQPEIGDEYLLFSFVDYLSYLRNESPIVFVVSKWDLVEDQWESCTDFARTVYRDALSVLAAEYPRDMVKILPFSVGQVSNPEQIDQIESHAGVEQIIEWLYEVNP